MSEPFADEFAALRADVAATRWVPVLIERRALDGDGAPTGAWTTVATTQGREMQPRGQSNPFQNSPAGLVDYQTQNNRVIELAPDAPAEPGHRLTLNSRRFMVVDIGGQSSHAIGQILLCQEA